VALSQRPSKKPKDDDARAAAARLGDYGDAPTEWWMAPVYAYRVKMRQLELRRELATKKAALDTARGAADDVLVALAQRGRKHVEHNDEYAKLLQTLKAAEAGLRERDSALAAETDAHGQKTAGIDEQIGHVEAELAALRADEKTAVEHFERLDAVRQRADAKAKRIEIELRAAIAKAGPPPSKSGLPRAADVGLDDPEVVAKTRERDARLAEVQQATPAVTEATKDLAACRKRVTSVQEKLLDLKNQRAAIEAQWKRRGAHHGAEVEKAEKAVRAAFAALGRACATDNSTFGPEWDEARKEIVALDKTAAARDEEVVLHAMALDAHDRATTQRGIVMVASIAALLAVLCVLPFVFSGSTHKEAAAAAPPTDQGE
jgi:DNA repair exonuclease SbcCD ATPase subunit